MSVLDELRGKYERGVMSDEEIADYLWELHYSLPASRADLLRAIHPSLTEDHVRVMVECAEYMTGVYEVEGHHTGDEPDLLAEAAAHFRASEKTKP